MGKSPVPGEYLNRTWKTCAVWREAWTGCCIISPRRGETGRITRRRASPRDEGCVHPALRTDRPYVAAEPDSLRNWMGEGVIVLFIFCGDDELVILLRRK